ncbi:hypothetical protein KC921_04215 [Candidatus Woesebacteria bacterium]|nr:hypothetical protein [Candidatus Woesebacteria bacterium]
MATEVTESNEQERRSLDSMARAYAGYSTLCGHDRELFWDDAVYETIKQVLGDNPVINPAVKAFYAEKQQEAEVSTIGRVPGSSSEYAAMAARQIPKLEQELSAWTISEPVEFSMVEDLLDSISQNGLEGLDHEQVVDLFLQSPLCITGVSLAVQIYKAQQLVEERRQEVLQDRSHRERRTPSTTTPAERLRAYLKSQTQAEQS